MYLSITSIQSIFVYSVQILSYIMRGIADVPITWFIVIGKLNPLINPNIFNYVFDSLHEAHVKTNRRASLR